MRTPDRRCPCCLKESPSFLAICLNCNSEFWSAGRYEKVIPENTAPRNRWGRERINKSAKEAMRKAQEALEKMSQENKTQIEEDEKKIREEVGGFDKEDIKTEEATEETEDTSFAKEEPRDKNEEKRAQAEDLPMFERDFKLPEEGAMCLDSSLQAARYMIIYLMKRVNKGMNTWSKFNVATDREQKLANWAKGFRGPISQFTRLMHRRENRNPSQNWSTSKGSGTPEIFKVDQWV